MITKSSEEHQLTLDVYRLIYSARNMCANLSCSLLFFFLPVAFKLSQRTAFESRTEKIII